MNIQTIAQAMDLLEMIQQPAFCLDKEGSVRCNRAAAPFAPTSAFALPQWLGESMLAYEMWDHSGRMVLPLPAECVFPSVTLQPLQDGTLFLLPPMEEQRYITSQMSVTAQVVRQPLNELCNITQQLSETLEEFEDPVLQQQTASVVRHVFRLNRIACDLADLELLENGTYPVHADKLDLTVFLEEFSAELEDLCAEAGFDLYCKLPRHTLIIHADRILLERALLNLLSNAMKYGKKDAPLTLSVQANEQAVYFQLRNTCSQADSDLLSAAFTRLTQRGPLPDPRWGLGLGLPMALRIARSMGGTVAVEVSEDHTATVTISISRKRPLMPSPVNAPVYDYTGGMRRTLLELSDVLPVTCYDSTCI